MWLSMELLKCGMTPLTGLNFLFKSICQHLDYFSTHRSSFVVRKVHACAEFWTLSLSKKQKTPETNIFYIGIENFHNWWWLAKSGKFRWVGYWMDLKLWRILICTEPNSEKFHPLNPITRIKFWQCQIGDLTQHSCSCLTIPVILFGPVLSQIKITRIWYLIPDTRIWYWIPDTRN